MVICFRLMVDGLQVLLRSPTPRLQNNRLEYFLFYAATAHLILGDCGKVLIRATSYQNLIEGTSETHVVMGVIVSGFKTRRLNGPSVHTQRKRKCVVHVNY